MASLLCSQRSVSRCTAEQCKIIMTPKQYCRNSVESSRNTCFPRGLLLPPPPCSNSGSTGRRVSMCPGNLLLLCSSQTKTQTAQLRPQFVPRNFFSDFSFLVEILSGSGVCQLGMENVFRGEAGGTVYVTEQVNQIPTTHFAFAAFHPSNSSASCQPLRVQSIPTHLCRGPEQQDSAFLLPRPAEGILRK
ncbi:hypothetical protein B0H13DRAFT_1953811 [Mycena leptocephala]|nr:hypothetical protein B0H13DRAFT_1953811 [Mycena leptocephala]